MDRAAAFWLTMAATPEGAQGQVTFQLLLIAEAPPPPVELASPPLDAELPPPLLVAPFPQPARSPIVMAHARDMLRKRFFIFSLSFFIKFMLSACKALLSSSVCTISWELFGMQ